MRSAAARRATRSLLGAVMILLGGIPGLAGSGESGESGLAGSIERATGATVGILQETREDGGASDNPRFSVRGSGVHLGEGYLVTARHAVEREEGGQPVIPREITVLTTHLDEMPARLTGVNRFLDIALYRMEGNGLALPSAAFGEQEAAAGEEVFTVGYPLGWGPAVGFGRVGNPQTFLPTVETRLLQVDLSACSGNSGGGLFNTRGEIVGVLHAIIQTETVQADRRCSRFAFAVPGQLVKRIVTALTRGEQPGISRLGVQLTAVKVGTRWRVAVAEAFGPALDAGVRKGDHLLAIDQTPITSAAQLKTYLMEHTLPGQRVRLRVQRGERELVLSITLAKA